jgi:hypothetical protein
VATEIKERDAVEQLVKYLRREADIDDIAQIWSDRLGDDIVRVISADDDKTHSDAYLNGDRVVSKVCWAVGPKPEPALSQEQHDDYLTNRGLRCPICKSDNTTTDSGWDVGDNTGSQDARCLDCDAAWTDFYRLDDVKLKEAPTIEQE